MKNVLLFLLIWSFGCDRNQDSKTTNHVDVDVEAKAAIAEQLDGYWLSEEYLMDVDSSRSIYASINYQTKFWGFQLTKDNLMSESPTINGFTEHEGGYGGPIKFDSTKNTFVTNTRNADEYSFLKEPFEFKLIDSDHLVFDFGYKKDRYRKVSNDQVELRKLLFEGKFNDLSHGNQGIEFSRDGQITGLDKQKYFDLIVDFGEGIHYDVSVFYPHKDSSGRWADGDLFHFKINADTLKLYRITPDWDGMSHTIGDLEYLLVKS